MYMSHSFVIRSPKKHMQGLAFAIATTVLVLALALSIGSSAHAEGEIVPGLCSQGTYKQFREKVAGKISENLEKDTVGYALSISYRNSKDIVERAGGDARLPQDMPADMFIYPMSTEVKYTIASLHKTIVAAAIVKLLNQKGLSYDTPIGGYLPADWHVIQHPKNFRQSVADATFRQLMSQTSGIDDEDGWKGGSFEDMRNMVNLGIPMSKVGTYKYNNANFSLLVVTVPFLAGLQQQPPFDPQKNTYVYDHEQYALDNIIAFDAYVQANLFQPIGLPTILAKPADPSHAGMLYPVPTFSSGVHGLVWPDDSQYALYHMGVKQIHAFYQALNYTSILLPAGMGMSMMDETFGYDPTEHLSPKTYTASYIDRANMQVFGKNGGLTGLIADPDDSTGVLEASVSWQAINYNKDFQITAMTNSARGGLYSDIVKTFYDSNTPTSLSPTHLTPNSFVAHWESVPYHEDTYLTHVFSPDWFTAYQIQIWDPINTVTPVFWGGGIELPRSDIATVFTQPNSVFTERSPGEGPSSHCNQRSFLIDQSMAPFLEPGKEYAYSIRAVNVWSDSKSQYSETQKFVLPLK